MVDFTYTVHAILGQSKLILQGSSWEQSKPAVGSDVPSLPEFGSVMEAPGSPFLSARRANTNKPPAHASLYHPPQFQ